MDIQAEKELLISRLAELKDIDVIRKINQLLKDELVMPDPDEVSEISKRAEASERAITKGKVVNFDSFDAKFKHWKEQRHTNTK